MNLTPLKDRVVIKPSEESDVRASGLIIPSTAQEKPQQGVVLAVGAGTLSEAGDRIPLDVARDDTVLYSKYGGTEITIDGEDLIVLREQDILARVG